MDKTAKLMIVIGILIAIFIGIPLHFLAYKAMKVVDEKGLGYVVERLWEGPRK